MHPLIQLYGSTSPLPESVQLRAGKIELLYESGFLRYIKSGETEILRMINYRIRDENWNTIPMTIIVEKIDHDEASFNIQYTALCHHGNIQFQWNCRIRGREDSTITFDIEGEALQPFKRNRLGFNVLHPIETCSGNECVIMHDVNTKETLRFPKNISPHQPFLDIVGMEWKPAEGIEAELKFEGDIFETEDQRNWSDASFKTYCTPLSKPFPVLVEKGEVIGQTIHLSVNHGESAPKPVKRKLAVTLDKEKVTAFPKVGVPLSDLFHNTQQIQWIKDLQIDFLRVKIDPKVTDIPVLMREALKVNLPLELVLFFEKDSYTKFFDQLLPFRDHIVQIIILPSYESSTDADLISRIVPFLQTMFPKSKIGGGTDAFFTELNRKRTPADALDFLSFSLNPQVHASDIATMTENLAAQADVVKSCARFAKGKGIHVGPVTFKMRKNRNSTSSRANPRPGALPEDVDPRQLSLYGAAWTLGSFKYLAESNVEAITYYETCGWKGLFPHPEQRWPQNFLFLQHGVYPIYTLLKEILRHKESRIIKLISSEPLTFDGIAFVDHRGNHTIFLANYTPDKHTVLLPAGFKGTSYWSMNNANFAEMTLNPEKTRLYTGKMIVNIELQPFSVTVLG